MEGLISTFHLDIKLLVAQLVNFFIVLFVLYKFAYKPLLSKMNERTAQIEKGLTDAQKAQEALANAEKTREERVIAAKKEAKQILQEAQEMADKNKEDLVNTAKQEAQKVLDDAKKQISLEKEKMLSQVQQEIGSLVVLATEKVIDQKLSESKDKELINNAVGQVQ